MFQKAVPAFVPEKVKISNDQKWYNKKEIPNPKTEMEKKTELTTEESSELAALS